MKVAVIHTVVALALASWVPQSVAAPTFGEYQQQTRERLQATKPAFVGISAEQAIEAVMPFEVGPPESPHALLLVHGLTDSPAMLRSVAERLGAQGVHVRVLLLECHGSVPQACFDVQADTWRQQVREQLENMLVLHEQVYLGGFSMGGVLATLEGMEHPRVPGLLLWAPAWKASSSMLWLTDWLHPFMDWLGQQPELDYGKYASLSLNAVRQYHHLAKASRALLQRHDSFGKPVLVVASADDGTIDSQYLWQQFSRMGQFDAQLHWYGELPEPYQGPATLKHWPGYDEQARILGISHLGLTNSAQHPHYGAQGDYRNCLSHWQTPAYQSCMETETPWYGEEGMEGMEQHQAARLMFNPYFEPMMEAVEQFILQQPQ